MLASVLKPTQLHDVCLHLRSHGVAAFAPNTVPYATIRERAQIWTRHIDQVLKLTAADKLNVVAHSMGGLDLRYAITKLDAASKVALLTTVATPHRGSSIAELALNTPTVIFDLLSSFFNELGQRMYPEKPSDLAAAMHDMTRSAVDDYFNFEVPTMAMSPISHGRPRLEKVLRKASIHFLSLQIGIFTTKRGATTAISVSEVPSGVFVLARLASPTWNRSK